MSYPPVNIEQLRRVTHERNRALAEADRWRTAHASVVAQKRQLGVKYGAIMRRKPAARWRRLKKRLRRTVTKVTYKLGRGW